MGGELHCSLMNDKTFLVHLVCMFQPLSEILSRNMAVAIKNTAAPEHRAAPATPLPAAASLIEEVRCTRVRAHLLTTFMFALVMFS